MRITKKQAVPLLVFGFVFLLAAVALLVCAIVKKSALFVFFTIVSAVLCGLFFFLRYAFTKGPRDKYKDAAEKEELRRNGMQFEEETGGETE